MKKIFTSTILAASLIMIFILPASAVSFEAFQNVSDTVTGVNILMDAYKNSDNFSYTDDFLIFSDAQNSYYLIYGDIDSDSLTGKDLSYYRYYSTTTNGYSYNWLLTSGSFSDVFSFNNSNYTFISSSGLGGLEHSDFQNSYNSYLIMILITIFVVLFIFHIFRGIVGGGYN